MIDLPDAHVIIASFAHETAIPHARAMIARKERGEATQAETDEAMDAADRAIGQMIAVMPK